MSNNIYDILKKIESLEAPKKTNLTESKMTTVKELHNESKKEKQTNKGTIAEAVAQVEKQLSEKFHDHKKSMEESGLQAYLGKKKYGETGMKALQKAGREGASKEKMALLRAKHDKMDEGDDSYTQDMRDKDLAGLDRIFKKPAPNKELKYNGFVIRAEGSDLGVYYQGKDTGYNFQKLDQAKAFIDQYGGKFVDGELNEASYNEEMLSPKQKKIASMAGDPDKIDAKDFAALRGEKKGKKDESNKFIGNLMKARADGKDEADLDGDGDMEKVSKGVSTMREGWEEMQKYLDKKRGPESKGGEGKKAGTRYGGSAQKDDDDEETDGEGKPVEKKRGRPKGTGGGAKFSFKKPKD